MAKGLLILLFVSMAIVFAPSLAMGSEMESGTIEQVDERNISITVNQASVQVTGASGLTLEVVSLTGKRVMTVKIESPAQRVELNVPKGCYILKIGKVVRKVSIR